MPPETRITPFDLHRMVIGDHPPLFLAEIAVRTVVMYLFTLILIRFIGKRALSELSTFEYIMVFTMGSAVGDPMFYPEVPLGYGMVVLSVIVVLKIFPINSPKKSTLQLSI